MKIRVPIQKHKDSHVPQPIHSLLAFQRVPFAKGATANVDFEIPVERFHYWDEAKNAYVVDPGAYELQIGASSQDIRQTCAVTVTQLRDLPARAKFFQDLAQAGAARAKIDFMESESHERLDFYASALELAAALK